MKIEPFAVEQWMNEFELRCTYNLAETCVASLTVAELLDLAGGPADLLAQLLPCLLYTSPSPRDRTRSRMPSSA